MADEDRHNSSAGECAKDNSCRNSHGRHDIDSDTGCGCSSGHDHPHVHDYHQHSEQGECCSLDDCICTESCQSTYASLLHTSSSCRRPTLVRQTCSHCLRAARAMATGAKSCYCRLTRSLCRSVRSLGITEQFSLGCCRAEKTRHPAPEEPESEIAENVEISEKHAHAEDLESGGRYTRRLTLGVAGMHCSSCADDLMRVLARVQGVESGSVKVSFMMSRAEVKYDPRLPGANAVVMERIKRRFPRLEVVVLGDVEEGEDDRGVRVRVVGEDAQKMAEVLDTTEGVKVMENTTTRIQTDMVEFVYNADRIGIRSILERLRDIKGLRNWHLEDVPDPSQMAEEAERRQLRKLGTQTLLTALFTIPVLVLAWSGKNIRVKHTVRLSVEMACATVVMGVAHNIFTDAFRSIVFGGEAGFWSRINVDCLVSIATLSAYSFSTAMWAMDLAHKRIGGGHHHREPFFETSSLLITLILAGRWVTAAVRTWASKKLRTVGGDAASRMTECRLIEDDQERIISTLELEYEDVLAVSHGEIAVTDGLVIGGFAQVDESHLTGEAKPQNKRPGDYVIAGSKVVSGEVRYRVQKLVQENMISSIKDMVKLASRRPRAQEIADKVASVLTPIILLIGIIVFVVWLLVSGLAKHRPWSEAAITATTYTVATLAISCPCAIGLAVPIVIVVASRVGITKCGFVLKNPAALEKAGKLGVVVFDKTGTLTTGQLQVEKSWALNSDTGEWTTDIPESTVTILRTLTGRSDHPVSKSILRSFPSSLPVDDTTPITSIPGSGLEATINGVLYRAGKLEFTSQDGAPDSLIHHLSTAQTIFTLSADSVPILLITLRDDLLRPEIPHLMSTLRSRNVSIYILSGDRPSAVAPLGPLLSLPESHLFSSCTPLDKASRLRHLATQHPGKTTMFIGDGTNDAVALAAADIGVAVAGGTEMATATADVVLVREGVRGVLGVLEVGKRGRRAVRVNFAWAVAWNLFAVLAASGVFVRWRFEAEWAGLGELGSVLPVFLVSAAVGWGIGGIGRTMGYEQNDHKRWWRWRRGRGTAELEDGE